MYLSLLSFLTMGLLSGLGGAETKLPLDEPDWRLFQAEFARSNLVPHLKDMVGNELFRSKNIVLEKGVGALPDGFVQRDLEAKKLILIREALLRVPQFRKLRSNADLANRVAGLIFEDMRAGDRSEAARLKLFEAVDDIVTIFGPRGRPEVVFDSPWFKEK
jgi:hypothetical protein